MAGGGALAVATLVLPRVASHPAPLDPNFLGVASFGVAADGRCRLRTWDAWEQRDPDVSTS